MITLSKRLLSLILFGLFMAACSGTKTTGSWSDQSYKGKIKNVYIIGIAKKDINRMIFENSFESRLASEGIKAIASYTDLLSTNQEVDREDIIQRMRNNNCDSVLLTRLVGQKTKGSLSGGRGTYNYTPMSSPVGPTSQRLPKGQLSYYNNWGTYYNYGKVNYVQPSSLDNVILTVESVLYDLQTEELIWSAQLETRLEGNIENMMRIFVDEVAKDLKKKGLI
jgi:hypothetical protein